MTLSSRAIEAGARALCAVQFGNETIHGEARCCQLGGTEGCCVETLMDQATACLTTALAAEGMVLVPKEPTERMKWVGHEALDQSEFTETAVVSRVGLEAMREVYLAMLSAHQADEDSEGKKNEAR